MNSVFEALADPTRRRVLEILRKGPMTAEELAEQFPVSRPTMSAHFAVLRQADLVDVKKSGKTVTYRLKLSVLEDAFLGFPGSLSSVANSEITVSIPSSDNSRFEGIGEYQSPCSASRERARRSLFSAMARVRPEFLQSLVDGPYQVALECGIDLSAETPSPPKKISQARRRVRKAAREWCARWRLVDTWCEELATDTALRWVREGNSNSSWAEEDWEWIAAASFPKFRDFEFKFKGWSCVLTTWRDFEAAALASYRDRLDQYREDAERAAVKDLRLVRTKSKRNADHYYWLARNLVLGQSPSVIAMFATDTSRDAVRKAIKRLARDLALTLPARARNP